MREQWTLGYRPSLDGVRAIAITVVVLLHAHVAGFGYGYLGVDVFFVLSGFLITCILVEELHDTGRIRLGAFWMRRVLRLLPALLVFAGTVMLLIRWMPSTTTRGLWPALFYVMNWFRISGQPAGAFEHTWSLAIEEQFYLLWPLALIGLWRLDRTLRLAMRVCAVVVLASAAGRTFVVVSGAPFARWYHDFFLRLDTILLGCLLALVLKIRPTIPNWMRDPNLIVLGLLMLFAALLVGRNRGLPAVPTGLAHTFAGVATVLIIIGCVVGGTSPIVRVLEHPVMVWLGRRSYGIYLWHWPFLRTSLFPSRGQNVVWSIAITLVVAELSFRFVESPLLRLKSRFNHAAVPTHPRSGEVEGLRPVGRLSTQAGVQPVDGL